ncbi:MAG: helix-turn-helix domain-containing protein [Candidatus Woesearchaeota archaeon]|jgi:hypothetical protein
MYKFSFKIQHEGCSETALSKRFPKHHITVLDIQAKDTKNKQYLYYIQGTEKEFNTILQQLKKTYKTAKEIERTKDSLTLLVILHQTGYIQNIIQKNQGFFIDVHTISNGYEYWHIGVIEKSSIQKIQKQLKNAGKLEVLYIGKIDFAETFLSKQQKKVFSYAYESGYYQTPRKITIAKIAQALHLNHSTVGEHLCKAENKLITVMAKKI